MNSHKGPAPEHVVCWRCPFCHEDYESREACRQHMAEAHKRTMTTHWMQVEATLRGAEEPDRGLRRCPRVTRDSWTVDADLAELKALPNFDWDVFEEITGLARKEMEV